MNLPKKLTMLRICLVPVFMIVMITPMIENDILCRIIAAALFIVTSLTDMLDGKIARKYNLITNFGHAFNTLPVRLYTACFCVGRSRGNVQRACSNINKTGCRRKRGRRHCGKLARQGKNRHTDSLHMHCAA